MFVTKMKTVAVVILALAVIVSGAGGFAYHVVAKAVDAKTDKENIQGPWKTVSIKFNGKNAPPENVQLRSEMIITADKITVRYRDTTRETTYKVDPKADPKTLDEGDAGGTILCIYKLEGDTLTICYNPTPKEERPKEFESKEGSNTVLWVLKRVKK